MHIDPFRAVASDRLALAGLFILATIVFMAVFAPVLTFFSPDCYTGQIFSHALGVFATDDYGDQAVLSSNLHQLWAITYGSGMRNDPRYTPSDVFETFPRPAQQ